VHSCGTWKGEGTALPKILIIHNINVKPLARSLSPTNETTSVNLGIGMGKLVP
jgi:hypothetical protein